MPTREESPAGVPCYVDSGRPDSAAAREFYGGLFGWEFEDQTPEGVPSYHLATLNGQIVAGIGTQPDQEWESVWNTYIKADDADAALARIRDAGATIDMEPTAFGGAGRFAAFTDPQGAQLCLWEPDNLAGWQLVNAAGAVVFNTLHTPDLAGAVEFYGAALDWQMEAEGYSSWMIRQAGYADFQERIQPGFNAMQEQMGAPDGFADLIAAVAVGEPPRWEITFAVESADDAAAKVEELGGTIVSPPADAPWVRETVVKDTDGVQIMLSQFVPPED